MHDGMPYDPIQGQDEGHGACEVPKIALLKVENLLLSGAKVYKLMRLLKTLFTPPTPTRQNCCRVGVGGVNRVGNSFQ